MARRSSVLVVAALFCVLLGCPQGAAADRAEIAFGSAGKVYSALADGSGRRLLLAPRGRRESFTGARWSRDGQRLAFTRYEESARELDDEQEIAQLMVFEGGANTALTPARRGTYDSGPSWSPDGRSIAFGRSRETEDTFTSSIVVRDIASGAERELTKVGFGRDFSSMGAPVFSPDGRTLAYTRSRLDRTAHFRSSVYLISADGTGDRKLIDDAQLATWSPDQTRLAFSSMRDRNGEECGSDECWYRGEIYTSRADGGGLVRLTHNKGDDQGPQWAPDGSRLLFTSDQNYPDGDGAEAYSVKPDGSCLTWITNGTPSSGDPSWRSGGGTDAAPGSCDPSSRPALVETRAPRRIAGALWLGWRFRGLILSDTSNADITKHGSALNYGDCERFDSRRCPASIYLRNESICGLDRWRHLTLNPYRVRRSHGALIATYGGGAMTVFSGPLALEVGGGDGRKDLAGPILRSLRPFAAAQAPKRLPGPHVPRRVRRSLNRTAAVRRRLGDDRSTAGALKTGVYRVRRQLLLRRVLRGFHPARTARCG